MIPVNLEFWVGWKRMLLFPLSRYSLCVYLERMVTDSVVLGHTLEAYIRSPCQEIPCSYGTLMFIVVYRELCSLLPKKGLLRSFLKLPPPPQLRLCLYFFREFQNPFLTNYDIGHDLLYITHLIFLVLLNVVRFSKEEQL